MKNTEKTKKLVNIVIESDEETIELFLREIVNVIELFEHSSKIVAGNMKVPF